MTKAILCVCIAILSYASVLSGQTNPENYFRDFRLKVDTLEYSYQNNSILVSNEKKVYFRYDNADEVCQVSLFPTDRVLSQKITLLPSGDYAVVDSLLQINNQIIFKVKFNDLFKSDFLSFRFKIQETADSSSVCELKLFPYSDTHVFLLPSGEDVFIGEEKVFELGSDNVNNIKAIPDWQSYRDVDYRITSQNGQLKLHVIPKGIGLKSIKVQLETYKPFLDSLGKVSSKLPPLDLTFAVKQSRIRFVSIDRNDVTLDDDGKLQGIEIQLDNAGGLDMQKTYRIENQEEPGGALIAELFTKNTLSNNRILCILRVYNFHREAEGYLFIKDADKAKFITNFSITPKTNIQKISILHEGLDWSGNLSVSPGEIVDVKIEGASLNKAKFKFEDAEDLSSDTTLRNENIVLMKIKIPLNINKRKIELFSYGNPTGYSLNIREFQEAREFDYITVNYGLGDIPLTKVKGLLMSPRTIKDIVFDFDRNLIDSPLKLYGKQYIKLSIKITNKNGELVELRDIDNICVIPGENSIRSVYYDKRDETSTAISLNKYLRKKTYELEDWAKIEISVENKSDKYSNQPFRKELELYVQKEYRFDIDVSFPAGLLINTFDKSSSGSQYQSFGGISMAMMAQFSFYDQERPGKYKPYKIGAGFLALNAFNLSSDANVNRDMGVVVIGSLYPTRKDVKLTFPLHVGGGYMLNKGKWFVLIGPGISVRL